MALAKVPAGVGPAGRKVWRAILADVEDRGLELSPSDLILLETAARTADTIARLEADLVGQPSQVRGSQGQLVANGLFAELRQSRALLGITISRLNADEDPKAEVPLSPAQLQSRKANRSRQWHARQRGLGVVS